jgi:uncharacterized protein YjiS (DUF1127 family)
MTKHQLRALTDDELYDMGILRKNIEKVVAMYSKIAKREQR